MDHDPNAVPIPGQCREAECVIEVVRNDQQGGWNVQHNKTSTYFERLEVADPESGEPSKVTTWLLARHAEENPPPEVEDGLLEEIGGAPA